MFNSMLDELKEVQYFKEITDFRSYSIKYFKEIKRLKSPQVKAEACFTPEASIYDGAFL